MEYNSISDYLTEAISKGNRSANLGLLGKLTKKSTIDDWVDALTALGFKECDLRRSRLTSDYGYCIYVFEESDNNVRPYYGVLKGDLDRLYISDAETEKVFQITFNNDRGEIGIIDEYVWDTSRRSVTYQGGYHEEGIHEIQDTLKHLSKK